MKKSLKMICSDHFLKYIRYKQNHFTCSHENKITRFLQSSWKILRKLLNWNHISIYNQLYLKNIMIWLMFSRNKMSTSYLHIKKNMILKLIWNQKKLQTLNLYTTCHETNFKYYNNILMNILQKISFSQVVFCLCFWYYSLRNQTENYISALIIKLWMWLWFEIDTQFSWFKKYWINSQKHNILQNSTSLSFSIKFTYEKVMRNILSFKHNENYSNNLWCYLIWKTVLAHFSITSITSFMIFLIFLWLHTLTIFWSTCSHYLNIKNMY